jgi:hypothetical protein
MHIGSTEAGRRLVKKRTGFEGFRKGVAAVLLAALGAFLPLQGVHAKEGVIQINQARAIEGGVTAGDTAGFPVTISASGTYVLTGDLQPPDTATTAISVTADWVTIDLNGFEIAGPNVCTWNGSGVDCTATSTGDGINAPGREGLTVRNGIIRGVGDDGIEAGTGASVESVTADGNGGVGILVGYQSHVALSAARLNGGHGVAGGQYCILAGIAARNNDGAGIDCSGRCIVSGSTAVENGGDGIDAGTRGVVHDNVSEDNGGYGFDASAHTNVYNNVASSNGQYGIAYGEQVLYRSNTVRGNGSSGIHVSTGSLVLNNVIRVNHMYGLNMGGGAYVGNNLLGNYLGDVNGDGTELGLNLCNGSTTCP